MTLTVELSGKEVKIIPFEVKNVCTNRKIKMVNCHYKKEKYP